MRTLWLAQEGAVGSFANTLEIALLGQSGRLYGPRAEWWGGNVRAQSSSSHTLEGALIAVLLALAGGLLYLVEISRPTADTLMPFVLLLLAVIAVFWRLRRWPARPWFVLVMFLILGFAGYGIWLLWYTMSRVPVAV
jgi:hypothetical protein